jgi:hypothetical protein
MEVTISILWTVAQITIALLFVGLGIIGLYIKSEMEYVKKAIAVILAANPELTKKVEKFTKKEE